MPHFVEAHLSLATKVLLDLDHIHPVQTLGKGGHNLLLLLLVPDWDAALIHNPSHGYQLRPFLEVFSKL